METRPMKHYKLLPHCKSDWPLSIHYYMPFPCHEPLHDHDCHEIMIVLNGTGWCRIGEKRYPVLPGMVFLIPPGETHEYEIPLGTLIFNIMFSPDIFSAEGKTLLSSLQTRGAAQCPVRELDRLKEQLMRIDRELTDQSSGYRCLTAAILTELLVVLARGNWDMACSTSADAPDILNTVIAYIGKHYREHITLEIIGKLVNLNPAYVGQYFRRYTWKSLNQYIQEIRIAKACSLMENTDWSGARIAAETGFFDSAHFTRAFRRVMGMTPREYAKSRRIRTCR